MKRFITCSVAAGFVLAALSVYAEAPEAAEEAAPAKAEAKANLKKMTCPGKIISEVNKVGDEEITAYSFVCNGGAKCPMGTKCVLPDVKIEGVDLSKLVGKDVEMTCMMDGNKIVEVHVIKETPKAAVPEAAAPEAAAPAEQPEQPSKSEHPEHPSK
ncbi:MAG: hypothetical protein HYV35_10690 [Lentisphaerae bacterium]|nr:hypothetical protein [Lentisphaerota bacterium]